MANKVQETTIESLIPDDKNANKGTEFGQSLMEKSFRQFGAGRSILIDKNNRIIAGNKSAETAMSIGMDKVRIIETTGDELIAVKRIDVDLDSKQGRELAIADNATGKANLDFDEDVLNELADGLDIDYEDWGIEFKKKAETEILSGLDFAPIYYQPQHIPNFKLSDCVMLHKFDAKVKALDEYDLTDEQKETLKLFCYRFIRIDFESVANYYAYQATEEEQKAMERLRLVLTDTDKQGFIEDALLRVIEDTQKMAEDD